MSRCFPYPPPGYARKVARTEAALIESIKLSSERQGSSTERKNEKSKHKKEKSKDKKHKSKEHKEKSSRSRNLSDQKRKEAKDLQKGIKIEAEQLEKSGLTEEYGQPVWPQSPGYLSDGSQINHKRKREASLQPNEGSNSGKIIRIKLASSLSQHEDSSAGSQQTCSTSGRDNSLHQKRDDNGRGPIEQKPCLGVQKPSVTVAVKDPISKPKIKDPPLHAVKDIGSTRQSNVVSLPRSRSPAESAYEAVIEKWVPLPLQLEQRTDDEEWLFGTRKQDGQTTTANKAFNSVPSCRSSSLWPRGQYLPDADVYSLPYTIPF